MRRSILVAVVVALAVVGFVIAATATGKRSRACHGHNPACTTTATTTTTTTTTQPPSSNIFYVSPTGNNSDGTSWATAWTDTSNIVWANISDNSVIYLDGGSSNCSVSPYDFGGTSNPGVNCGIRYSPFNIGHSNITIAKSIESNHAGSVVIDGGRDTPLPYCGQSTYSASTGSSYGINLQSYSGVTIDGVVRSGIIIRGSQNGIRMGPGGNETLRNLELFDNGYPISHAFGYSSDGNNILMGGQNNVYDHLFVHDGGQDEFHSDSAGYSEAGSTVKNSWMGAMRSHPSYPGEPFNDLQKSGADPGCTHADGIQIFAPGTTMSGLTIDHDVFGPGLNQGLYPSDSGTGTTFNNVSVTNSLFLDVASHNIITDNPVNGWFIDHVTIFATQGGFEIPGNGTNTMNNVIKSGGYVSTPGGAWNTSGNDWWLGDPLPGVSSNVNPNFVSAPTGTLPSLSSLRSADLTSGSFPNSGSPIHSWSNFTGN